MKKTGNFADFDGVSTACCSKWKLPVNGGVKVLVPTLKLGDVVVMDNLGSHKNKAVRLAIRSVAPWNLNGIQKTSTQQKA